MPMLAAARALFMMTSDDAPGLSAFIFAALIAMEVAPPPSQAPIKAPSRLTGAQPKRNAAIRNAAGRKSKRGVMRNPLLGHEVNGEIITRFLSNRGGYG